MRKLVYKESKKSVAIGDKHHSCTWLVEVASINPSTGIIRMRHCEGASYEYDEKYPGNFDAEWTDEHAKH